MSHSAMSSCVEAVVSCMVKHDNAIYIFIFDIILYVIFCYQHCSLKIGVAQSGTSSLML